MPSPSKDWAIESAEFINSPKHRSIVTKWFNEQNKYNIKESDYLKVARKFNMFDADTLFASIENGTIRLKSLVNRM